MKSQNAFVDEIEKAAEILKIGGVITFPTETGYKIGASILNEHAIMRIFELKKRPTSKPLSIAVSSFEMLEKMVYLNKEQRKKAKELLPGPVTVILPKKELVSDLITRGNERVGVDFPKDKTANKLVDKLGFPMATASASFSEKIITNPDQLEVDVDFILKTEEKIKYSQSSTVVDLVDLRILKEGAGIKKVKEVLGVK